MNTSQALFDQQVRRVNSDVTKSIERRLDQLGRLERLVTAQASGPVGDTARAAAGSRPHARGSGLARRRHGELPGQFGDRRHSSWGHPLAPGAVPNTSTNCSILLPPARPTVEGLRHPEP